MLLAFSQITSWKKPPVIEFILLYFVLCCFVLHLLWVTCGTGFAKGKKNTRKKQQQQQNPFLIIRGIGISASFLIERKKKRKYGQRKQKRNVWLCAVCQRTNVSAIRVDVRVGVIYCNVTSDSGTAQHSTHSLTHPLALTQIMCSMCTIVYSFAASISNKRIFGICGKTSTEKHAVVFLFCLVVAATAIAAVFVVVLFSSFDCFMLIFHVLLIVLVHTWNQQLSFSTKGCVFVCCSQFARCSHSWLQLCAVLLFK